jgi:hypothetical protein
MNLTVAKKIIDISRAYAKCLNAYFEKYPQVPKYFSP